MTSSFGNDNHNYQPISVPPVTNKRFTLDQIFLHRRARTLISSLAILLLIWVAAGIGNLSFAPGRPLNFGDGEVRTIQETLGDLAREFSEVPFGQQVLFVGIFISVTAISLLLMPSELRKRLLRMLFRMGVTAFALLYFFNNFQIEGDAGISEDLISPLESIESLEGEGLVTEVYISPQVSSIWNYVITLVFILLVLALGWRLSRNWGKPKESDEEPLEEFARIAQTSLHDLSKGTQWEDVIIRSYMQMGDVVRERRGIYRQQAMTPHEFTQRLEKAGLPSHPVQQLTRLFERVRYGTYNPGQYEVDEAVDCLNAISACFEEKS